MSGRAGRRGLDTRGIVVQMVDDRTDTAKVPDRRAVLPSHLPHSHAHSLHTRTPLRRSTDVPCSLHTCRACCPGRYARCSCPFTPAPSHLLLHTCPGRYARCSRGQRTRFPRASTSRTTCFSTACVLHTHASASHPRECLTLTRGLHTHALHTHAFRTPRSAL